jgi:hypothetical protein
MFLHRVRIHGGEFDSSARAMNRAEESNLFKAGSWKFQGSTFERKQMSTTIKRVALVAVAALGLSVVAVAPSQAFTQSDTLTLSSATATQLTGETLTATSPTATLTFLATAAADTMTVSAFLISAPAGNTVLPTLVISETANAVVSDTANGTTRGVGYVLGQNAFVGSNAATVAVSAKFSVYLNGPTLPGTYSVLISPAVTVTGNGALASTAKTLTFTVSANPSTDNVVASATSILTTAADTTTAADVVVTAPMEADTANEVAVIKVTTLNAAGVARTGESFTATIAGPGLLASQTFDNALTAAAVGRAITVKAGDVVTVYADGTSGVSTITISSAAGKVLATETVTFYGAVASATATVVKPVINASSNQAAILVNLKDAAGTTVSNAQTFYVTSSATTVISGAYTTTGSVSYSATNGTLGAGYLINLTGVAAGTANITVGTKSSATATGVEAAAVSIRVGSSTPDSVKVSFDKSSYAPGEVATITVSVLDDKGLALADGTYTDIFATGGIVGSYTVTGDTTTATSVVQATGSKTYKIYMPVTEGDVKFSWTTGTGLATANDSVAGSVTVNVSSAATSAAIDAANEAAQAASDATDAALAAADAADAATTKAQEAVDAVATLSAQVSKLITALKAQITTLTNLVIKIQKKVRA